MTKSPIMKASLRVKWAAHHFVGIKERFAANSFASENTLLRTARDA